MNENLNNTEMQEIDEEIIKKIARKYTLKTITSVIVVFITLALVVVSFFSIAKHVEIKEQLQLAEKLAVEKRFSLAANKIEYAERLVNKNNKSLPVFSLGNKYFLKRAEYYRKAYGPIECKALLKHYYPDSKYPVEVIKYIKEADVFTKAYEEYYNALYKGSNSYKDAYENIEKIASENPEYPEYVTLYFHLAATQFFEESAASQIAAYNALEKKAPDEVWLYAAAGTRALIKNNELNKALRLCPDSNSEEANAMRVKIYRMMGEYRTAGMFYDECRSYDSPSEVLDREMLIIGMLEGNTRMALDACSYYTKDLDNCKTSDMLYTLWIAAIKANDKKLKEKISDHIKEEKIPVSQEVQGYDLGNLTLTDLFLDGESDLC